MTSSKLFVNLQCWKKWQRIRGVLAPSSLKTLAQSYHMQNLYVRHQKLCCPKHSHHLPSVGILYHLLLRPVTSHLLWFLWTFPYLSAPEHQHAGFCPPEFQQYVILSVSSFLLACIKMMNVFEKLQTSPIPLVLWFTVSHFRPLFWDFFSCLISSIDGSRSPAGHHPAFKG